MRQRRLVKAGVFADLVDGMDRIIAAGVGGLGSRSDVINEALDAYIAEMTLDWQARPGNSTAGKLPSPDAVGVESYAARVAEEAGELHVPSATELLSDGQCLVNTGPLFFHNRDYPSLWAALTIAELTREGLLPFDKIVKETTSRAWRFAEGLRSIDAAELKPTVLFPTNREKRDAAEAAFRSFAIGTCSRDGSSIICGGPLFVWGICQAKLENEAIVAGITPHGFELLRSMDGLDACMPHDEAYANKFFAYVRENAPDDLWGFQMICRLVRDKPSREQLLNGFGAAAKRKGFTWTAHQIANYVSGYISRAREWGLVVPKLVAGRYELTRFGNVMREEFEVAA